MSLPQCFPLKVAGGGTIQIPSVGFGTWAQGVRATPPHPPSISKLATPTSWVQPAVLSALRTGYRRIDSAWMYDSSASIGSAIRSSKIPREEIFVTSKVAAHFLAPENVELCLDQVLAASGLDPMGPASMFENIAIEENGKLAIDWEHSCSAVARRSGKQGSFIPTWQALQDLVRKGKARAVGVSNFSIDDLEEIIPYSSEIPISCNQVEAHPWLPNDEVIAFGAKHGILTTAHSPFAGGKIGGGTLLTNPTVAELARQTGMGVGQLLQSWAVQRGTPPIGKSVNEARIKENFDVRRLEDDVIAVLDGLRMSPAEGRTADPSPWWGVQMYEDSGARMRV